MAYTPTSVSAAQACKLASERLNGGDFAGAEQTCRKVLAAAPRYYPAAELLAITLEAQGRYAEALAGYEEAARLSPGEGLAFSRAAMLRLRGVLGPPKLARVEASTGDRISMVTLGNNGRIGNQLLQYAFLRLYAAEHGMIAEAPDWVGRDLFDLDDPFPSRPLPRLREDQADWFGSLNRRTPSRYANVDVGGFFCGETSAWGDRRAQFRRLFQPGQRIAPILQQVLANVRSRGRTLVAVHLRRGDFGYGPFWLSPAQWYSRWLREIWPRLDAPILYVASDDPRSIAELGEFSPMGVRDAEVLLPGAGFMIDHFLLSHADELAISNSTFSFTAAMLNERARTFVRPDPDLRILASFDPWNARVLLQPTEDPAAVSAGERLAISRMIKLTDTIVHVGKFCSQWTTCVRTTHPQLIVREVDSDESIDPWRVARGIARLNFVAIGDGAQTARIIAGVSQTLKERRVDFVQFQMRDAEALQAAGTLIAAGYQVHPMGALGVEAPVTDFTTGSRMYIAIAPQGTVCLPL